MESAEVGSTSNTYEAIRVSRTRDGRVRRPNPLQFVNEEPQTDEHDAEEPHDLPIVQESGSIWSPRQPAQKVVELPVQTDRLAAHSTHQHTPMAFSDNDESAVAGLLALGTSNSSMLAPDSSLSEFGMSPARQSSQGWTPRIPHAPAFFSQESNLRAPLQSSETLELLRHYRYEVAPHVCIHPLISLYPPI